MGRHPGHTVPIPWQKSNDKKLRDTKSNDGNESQIGLKLKEAYKSKRLIEQQKVRRKKSEPQKDKKIKAKWQKVKKVKSSKCHMKNINKWQHSHAQNHIGADTMLICF